MSVNFPGNCTTEASRWSYSVKLNEVLRVWHNANCPSINIGRWKLTTFHPKIEAVHKAINEQIAISETGSHWSPKIPDNASGGVITYPPGLDQSNEGSRGSFLFGLMEKLRGREIDDPDVMAVESALKQAKQDAINGPYWNPSMEDIING